MILDEAIKKACEGNFVSNKYFTAEESMHEYNDRLYYEDGAVLGSALINIMHDENWSKDGWYIKYSKEQIDRNKLNQLHKEFGGTMISSKNRSYEECVIK